MEKNKLKIKSNIEKSQIYLINKTFFFFQYLKKKKICLAKSSFSYLSSYGNTLGTGLLNYWLKKNFFVLLICILKNILSISTLKYLTLTKIKIVNFENIIITWGKIADFENGKFKDIFLNINSDHIRNTLIVVLYDQLILPKQIPSNVVIVYLSKNKKNVLYLIKSIINFLKENKLSLIRFVNYFSYTTQYSEKILFIIKKLINSNNLKKIIMPYEGQVYQNLIISDLKKQFPNCKTFGVVHAMLPALPLNYFYRTGSPDIVYLCSKDQKEIFIKHLHWPKKKLIITNNIRLKKKINKNLKKEMTIYLPIQLFKANDLIKIISKFLQQNSEYHNKFTIRKHPQKIYSKNHVHFENQLQKALLDKNTYTKANIKLDFYLGCTTSFIENLIKDRETIHVTMNPVLDCYSSKLWENILIEPIASNIFKYSLLNKNSVIRLSDDNFGLKNLKIL